LFSRECFWWLHLVLVSYYGWHDTRDLIPVWAG
jgi:hypothetical protein